jgi:hypothetical protein
MIDRLKINRAVADMTSWHRFFLDALRITAIRRCPRYATL